MKRQVCPLCALDDDIVAFVTDSGDGSTVLVCEGSGCDGFSWTPSESTASGTGPPQRTGIGEELGVYDDLLGCINNSNVWLEYGVIEHRYKEAHPRTYAQMVDRWGHRAKEPAKYSASSFLGGCLGQLGREGLIATRRAPTTGYWSYLGAATHASAAATPDTAATRTWVDYAADHGLSPDEWTL